MTPRSFSRTGFAFAVLLSLTGSVWAQQGQMPEKKVGVIEMQRQDVPRVVIQPGRAVANARAQIRPQVSGLVTEILYEAGKALEKGDPMFRIDDTTYQANVTKAEADVASAQATVDEAASAYSRAEQLAGSGVSLADVENARAASQQAQAALKSAEAALHQARVELDRTTVTSPIAGIASVALVSVGDLVTENQADALATVTRLDPIDVDVYAPSVRMLETIDDIAGGTLSINGPIKARLTLEGGRSYEAAGTFVTPGFEVSTSTGAVETRFRFENPDNLVLPGMFVRARVEIGTTRAFLVTQGAARRDKTGKLQAWVVEDGKAVRRDLTDVGTYQNQWIVTDGLSDGDLLVVDGLSGLSEGAAVTTVPVELDEDGVPRDRPADGAAATAE